MTSSTRSHLTLDRSERAEPDGRRRILVVADTALDSSDLVDEIKQHTDGSPEVRIVAPAVGPSPLKLLAGDVDEAIEDARRRVRTSVDALRRHGLSAIGDVGEADPNLAIEDALRTFQADEVIVATPPRDRASWLEKDVIERARREIRCPVTHVVVDSRRDSGPGKVEQVERIPARPRRRLRAEPRPAYLPPMPVRDRIALAVGVIGTVVLVSLALACSTGGGSTIGGGCAARILIATWAFIITVWHSAALVMFGSAGYHGRWSAIVAYVLLFGIPAGVVASLIVG
jgi:hypothetical protein